ncbi:MAG TPA: D-alanyl-D-alanine carboxypeptidase/D-alanyl-D-alanine-endopeptidase [Nocardioides sp.]|uniref:D-alanyl-D-alanine carboxypeptidase/D-alanyl-D-alanine endopeptidase n=1 Tax=Nocardioides sp. TaxID=35761 RepID=UPI002F3EE713
MSRAERRSRRRSRRRNRTRSRTRRALPWVAGVLVLALAGGAAAAYRTGRLEDWFGDQPAPLVAPVPGFTAPPAPWPRVVARTAPSAGPTGAAVRRALGPALHDPHLADLRAVVAPLEGAPVLDLGHGTSTPASTLKLLTAVAALEVLRPETTFATRVVTAGRREIVLVGGGDPFLESKQPAEGPARHDASLETLASRTAKELHRRGVTTVRLTYDTSLFSGPRVNPHWPKSYIPDDVVTPTTALWADEGLNPDGYGRVPDPPATAAGLFASYLRKDGIEVRPAITQAKARRDAREVASVTSLPVADIVERVLQYSDNEGAEVLAHQVGLAVEGEGSYDAGVRGVTRTLHGLGIDLSDATIQDGSGLSRHDRLDAETLVRVLQMASSPDHPELRSVITGLPIAAYDGSLGYRFDHSPGRGLVRAKTGTLTGTSALAGLTSDARGRVLVFAFVSNHVKKAETLDTRAALDRLASALATCRC